MMLKSKLLQTPTYQHLHCAKRPLRCSKKRNLGGHVPIAMACLESWVGPQSRKVALSNTAGKAYKTYHTAFSFMPEENFTHFITLKLPFTSLPVACGNGVARHWETAHYFHHQCLPLGIFLTLLTNTLLLAKVKPWTSLER